MDRAISLPRRGLYSGRKECSPLYASLSVVAADLRFCNHHHYCTLAYYQPPTPLSYDHTYSRPHHEYLHHVSPFTRYTERASKDHARRHDTPTSCSTTSLRSPSNYLAPISDLTGAFRIPILRPLFCTSRLKLPNPATTSATAIPGNAPDIISQDRIDDCASTGQFRPTRGGRRDAGG